MFGSLGFCAIVTIVIIAVCVTVVNKHHRSRQQAQRLRMAQYNPGTAVQYQPNQPLQLQAQNNYATDYGQGQSAFQYGVQNSAFQNGDQGNFCSFNPDTRKVHNETTDNKTPYFSWTTKFNGK